ncbi:PDR/VanB family oxidoreductase [Enemella sp. A6]|uniref:PDR/VanB family oxidoreductase n=1 Tax=Enemella sp. A6 TaxID=3440152 RepID=UPI003EBC61B4
MGARIEVDGPRDNFHLENAPSHMLMAGGIGITPIVAMARELQRRGENWQLFYSGRARPMMAFLDEITALPRERVHVHIDDESGSFPDLVTALGSLDPRTVVYACGPEPFMQAVEAAMPNPEQLRIERFKAPERIVPEGEEDGAFEVVISSSGDRVPVAADESILEALEGAGVDVPSSCTEGICGTCETKVLSGDIDHRDFLMTPEEHDQAGTMMICVSRCRGSELVLDI